MDTHIHKHTHRHTHTDDPHRINFKKTRHTPATGQHATGLEMSEMPEIKPTASHIIKI